MNNCHRDYSVRNAHEIGELLGLSGEKNDAEDLQKRLL